MKRVRRHYRPSKLCPHRWCTAIHLLILFMLIVNIGIDVFTDLWSFIEHSLLGGLTGVLLVALIRKSRNANNMADKAMGAVAGAGTPNSRLRVEASWARASIAMDLLFCVLISVSIDHGLENLKQHQPFHSVPLALALVFLVNVDVYVHWRATRRPRRRVRAEAAALAVSKA